MADVNSQTELEGQIEKVTYSNEETGYTVAKISVRGYRDPVTVVGNIVAPTPGEILLVKGVWINHPRFGRQFKVESHSIKVPATVLGIKKYLASGLIKGIGPVILAGECTNCGRCIDICSVEVFHFGTRFNNVEKVESVKGSAQHV